MSDLDQGETIREGEEGEQNVILWVQIVDSESHVEAKSLMTPRWPDVDT